MELWGPAAINPGWQPQSDHVRAQTGPDPVSLQNGIALEHAALWTRCFRRIHCFAPIRLDTVTLYHHHNSDMLWTKPDSAGSAAPPEPVKMSFGTIYTHDVNTPPDLTPLL